MSSASSFAKARGGEKVRRRWREGIASFFGQGQELISLRCSGCTGTLFRRSVFSASTVDQQKWDRTRRPVTKEQKGGALADGAQCSISTSTNGARAERRQCEDRVEDILDAIDLHQRVRRVPSSAPPLPSLQHLVLSDAFPGPYPPFDPRLYANLNLYPRLSSIDLLVLSLDSTDRNSEDVPEAQGVAVELSCIAKLSLRGRLSSPHSYNLVKSFTDISSLLLSDTSHSPNFFPLLEAANPLLHDLHVRWEPPKNFEQDDEPLPLIDTSITRLHHLSNLVVDAPSGPKLFDHLRNPLPLSSLALGRQANVTRAQVQSLIVGSKKLSALRELKLDVVNPGVMGRPSEEGGHGENWYSDPNGSVAFREMRQEDFRLVPDPSWRELEWTTAWPYGEAFSLVLDAEREGLSLRGSSSKRFELCRSIGTRFISSERWSAVRRRTTRGALFRCSLVSPLN